MTLRLAIHLAWFSAPRIGRLGLGFDPDSTSTSSCNQRRDS